ncbi:hypothetical protein T11_1153 [Trichinella zimbabwensis]|uniref:Uncharacterized protein n=1 Tax=Trichinella zimbabwensis TaxID=268475 RepID=A0A0V1HYS9_9BILA|nr:hypothetical protein T11_1153 [Trichinella zimbabwensis]
MGQRSETEAWRNVAVRLFLTGKLFLQFMELVELLLDDFPGFPLRPAPWDSVIASVCSRMKHWNAVKSDRNFSSAFISDERGNSVFGG